MRKSERDKLEDKLDKCWGEYGGKSNVCEICVTLPMSERCECSRIENHHIVGRVSKLLRWDLRNRIRLCSLHHTSGGKKMSVHSNWNKWFLDWDSDDDWMGKYRKEDKEYLRSKRIITYKLWSIEELEKILNSLKENI
jgi:hypothetical protein